MQVILKGLLFEANKSVPTINKNSEIIEVGHPTYSLYLEVDSVKSNGSIEKEMCKIRLNEKMMEKYKVLEGKEVEIPCTLFSHHPIAIFAVE